MIKKRIIFALLYKDGYFFLSRNFRLQKVGDVKWLINNFGFGETCHFIDELILNIPSGDGSISKNAKLIQLYLSKVEQSSSIHNLKFNNILIFIIIAFTGGIILNFMPCVFPVLSLKIYNVLSQLKNSSNTNIKKNLFATAFGIILCFFFIALLTTLLKKFGYAIGWGFQFQSPIFLSFIIPMECRAQVKK